MVSNKRDFFAKTVAEAMKAACKELGVPQEELDIEVVETGSNGIFGLIRKKAHIKVAVKGTTGVDLEESPVPDRQQKSRKSSPGRKKRFPKKEDIQPSEQATDEQIETEEQELNEESIELIRKTLDELLSSMGFPSTIDMTGEGLSVHCQIESEFESELTGPDGKTLDSIQYLLRKMIARKIPNRPRLAVDVGDFRQRRLDELKERAKEMGEKVKNDGKTRLITSLNSSERRVVHMQLQSDKGVKSRSVGDGLFKKVLIYKPGKKKRSNPKQRKKSRPGRRGNSRKKKTE